MDQLFIVYFKNSFSLSIIAILLFAISPILARQYSFKCRYYLWSVIFILLILPIRANITFKLPEPLKSIVPINIPSAVSSTTTTVPSLHTHLNYATILWFVGVICFLGLHLFQHLHFLSVVNRWSEDIHNAAILQQFTNTKDTLGIPEHVNIKSCACIQTPMVIGLFTPMVLLPQFDFSLDDLPLILKHELVHYNRKDLWYKAIMMITLSLHWFNPIVHLMVKSVLNLCEISCDEEVLKEIDVKGRAQYGETIIGMIRNTSACKTTLSTNFYTDTNGMKKRIYAMMDMTNKRFSTVLIIIVFMISVCGTTGFSISPIETSTAVQDITQTVPDTNSVEISAPSVTPDIQHSDSENQINDDSNPPINESEPRLILTYEYPPTETSPPASTEQEPLRLIALD